MEIMRYMDVPFTERGADWSGCNCWGLVALAFRHERGVELPRFDDIGARDLREASDQIERRRKLWQKVDEPQPFDVAVMTGISQIAGRSAAVKSHVGLVIEGGQVMHTEAGVGVSVLPIADEMVAGRIVEFRRYTGAC